MIGKLKTINGQLMVTQEKKDGIQCFNIHPDDLFNYKLDEGDDVKLKW